MRTLLTNLSNLFFGYIRVSTGRQVQGVSLIEQQRIIEAYALRNGLTISRWFVEKESAATRGRPKFDEMLRSLKRGEAAGVIIHKVDRSARNLSDWSEVTEVHDAGYTVHIAHDSLDLSSRGGRLTADIQAVIAADYSRNLRDEVKKGLWGRLRQGLYPWAAPVGYRDCGTGKVKEPHPIYGPLMKQAFELYASGSYSVRSLATEMAKRGLRNKVGKVIPENHLAPLLRNRFYYGLIEISTTKEVFEGKHEPLITKRLFDRVQAILDGRLAPRPVRHEFTYRRLIRCARCDRALVGERQKGHTYYRCHSATCARVSFREEAVDVHVQRTLGRLTLTDHEREELHEALRDQDTTAEADRRDARKALQVRVEQLSARLDRIGETGIIFHIRRNRELSALLEPGDQHRFQHRASGIDGGRVAGGAGAND